MRDEIVNHIHGKGDIASGIDLYARLPFANKNRLAGFRAGKDTKKLQSHHFWVDVLRHWDYEVRRNGLPTNALQPQPTQEETKPFDVEACNTEDDLLREIARCQNELGKIHRLLREIGDANTPEKIAERKPLVLNLRDIDGLIQVARSRLQVLRSNGAEVANTNISDLEHQLKLLRTALAKKSKNIEDFKKEVILHPNNKKTSDRLEKYKSEYTKIISEISSLEVEIGRFKQNR